LKNTGVCWVNLGDTYGGTGSKGVHKDPKYVNGRNGQTRSLTQGLMGKCLLQIPSRFAIEMIDRGWILRNEVIWHKPNSLPSSVKDRFTVDFEKFFMFTKSKNYYFEQQLEPLSEATLYDMSCRKITNNKGETNDYSCTAKGRDRNEFYNKKGRNKRAVWSINTKPSKEAHFATYPEELIKTPIISSCPVGGVVIDIFFGSGTTGVFCKKNKRYFIGIELNKEYCKIAKKRISNSRNLFT